MLNSDDQPQPTDIRRLPSPERTMTVTPLDLRQTKFSTAMRGFDRAEVTSFLLEAAEGYEQALRENERLRQELLRLEGSLTHYRELEGGLRNTLLSAQKVADDMRENASKEAARIVREAEGRAELLTQKAQAAHEDAQREIDALRLKRRDAEAGLESMISALHNTLEFIREQEDRDVRVVPHRPRLDVAAQSA